MCHAFSNTSVWTRLALALTQATALCVDGTVTVYLVKLDTPIAPTGSLGSHSVGGDPMGKAMGRIVLSQGHMALLPKGSAYRFHADSPSVLLQQTCFGPLTLERWAEICIS